MTNERKAKLFHGAMDWIWEHTEGYGKEEYVCALQHIGFTREEVQEELSNCCFDEDECECPLGGDETNDCADCAYSCDYHFVNGECVRREENE